MLFVNCLYIKEYSEHLKKIKKMVDKYKMKCYIDTNKRKGFRQKGTKEFLNIKI